MSQANNASQSILPAVAEQERELLARLRASEEEAQNIIEKARSDARAHSQESEAKLTDEVAHIRREAEAARVREFEETVSGAVARLEGVREEASRRVPELAKQVLSLFVPAATEEKS